MRVRKDGSIQASATPTFQNAGRSEDFGLYRCVVVKVKYVDDPQNITTNAQNPRVLYDCVVQGGFASGQKISNCRLSSDLGGNSSFWERTLRASSKDVSQTRLSDCDGDMVYVQFNQGHTGSPVIVAMDHGISVTRAGASKADGPRSLRAYNGVEEEINSSGELTIKVKGGTADAEHGAFTPADAPLVTFATTKDEKHSRTFKSGLSVQEDGKNDKVTITTASGVTALVDGKNNKVTITIQSTIVEIDGNTGKISLKSDFIDLGASVTDFVTMFTELAAAFNGHSHGGVVSGPGVSGPPTGPLLQTVGSRTVQVQP